jgi:hypothetical protein
MKKLLLSLTVVLTCGLTKAQDTLINHFALADSIRLFSTAANSYVFGNNTYSDMAKVQRFDNALGYTGLGDITKVLLGVGAKMGSGNFTVGIWSDNAGEPGTLIGSKVVSLSSIDTTSAAYLSAGGFAIYNVSVTFDSPVVIPADSVFYAGIILPTGSDAIGLLSTTASDFPLASTHSWEMWSDSLWYDVSTSWSGLDAAACIFPVVNFWPASTNELQITSKVYPNPAKDILNIAVEGEEVEVVISTLEGKIVKTMNSKKVDIADLTSGMYIYRVNVDGKFATGNFVKN